MLTRTFEHFKKFLLNNLIEMNMESCYELKLLLNFLGLWFISTQLKSVYIQYTKEREKRDLLKYKTMI